MLKLLKNGRKGGKGILQADKTGREETVCRRKRENPVTKDTPRCGGVECQALRLSEMWEQLKLLNIMENCTL